MKLVTQKELDEKLFKKPGFKEAYDELEWEYKIIDALIVARTKKGMTQAKLAGMVGTKQSAIARFESGRGNPTIDFIRKLSDALGLKLHITVR
jgi:ribosome-binding protein aMBF1 (putative translation factor)